MEVRLHVRYDGRAGLCTVRKGSLIWLLAAGRWTLDAGRWTLDAGRWTLVALLAEQILLGCPSGRLGRMLVCFLVCSFVCDFWLSLLFYVVVVPSCYFGRSGLFW